jgi:copper chaperone CopZ
METMQLTIPTMKNHHCQMTVTQAVQRVGASVKSMAPTKAVIEVTDNLTRQIVVEAIEKAGYKVQAN